MPRSQSEFFTRGMAQQQPATAPPVFYQPAPVAVYAAPPGYYPAPAVVPVTQYPAPMNSGKPQDSDPLVTRPAPSGDGYPGTTSETYHKRHVQCHHCGYSFLIPNNQCETRCAACGTINHFPLVKRHAVIICCNLI